jgi:proteasome lid subunit RPN8/RPN11
VRKGAFPVLTPSRLFVFSAPAAFRPSPVPFPSQHSFSSLVFHNPHVYDVYFRKAALDSALSHAKAGAGFHVETMGLLVGRFCKSGGRPWVLVEGYVTAPNKASSVSVRFSEASFGELSSKLFTAVSSHQVVVGWLHSHPGLGCFLSHTDVATQQRYFDHPQSIAAVVDPLSEGGAKKRVYRLGPSAAQPQRYCEISFAVIP